MEHRYDTGANAARHRAVRYRCDMDPVLAFIVAIAGWVLAALSLAWNVRQYFLTGARIRVKLGTRVFGSRLQTASVPAPRRLRRWLSMDTPSSRVPFGIVLLTVTIYNGRSPVTIDSITAKSGKAGISYADDETPCRTALSRTAVSPGPCFSRRRKHRRVSRSGTASTSSSLSATGRRTDHVGATTSTARDQNRPTGDGTNPTRSCPQQRKLAPP